MKPFGLPSLSLVVLGCALVAGPEAAATPIVYEVNQTIGAGSVVGSITTDGATGVLAQSDVTAWSLDINGVGASMHIDQTSSIVTDYGNDVSATAQYLYFNFSGTDGDLFLFQVGGPAGQNYWCNAVSSGECFQGKSAVPVYYSYASSQFASAEGKQIIGVAAANGVPEPAAWSLMLAGFAGLGVMLRRRVARASI